MSNTSLLFLLLGVPLLSSLLAFACHAFGSKARIPVSVVHVLGISALLLMVLLAVSAVHGQTEILVADRWLHLDSLNALFLGILGIVGFLTGLYSLGYMRHEVAHGEVTLRMLCNYYGFFHLFLFTMLLAITSNNLILMWVAIEATTLSSVFLVGLYNQSSSLEAAWKYVIICTVGVAFGLYGTILVYANAASVMPFPSDAIFWTEVIQHPELLDPTLMKLAFVFVLIGFGTKCGLFPMHAWLPDAHSEAPSPTSALLSAVLLNCALLIVVRYVVIINRSLGVAFTSQLLIVFGLMSVAVAAFFILVQRDIKRLLAYSSVENMGLIAVAIGIGGPLGIFAGLLHAVNHSLAKALLFCGSGNVLLRYGTRDMNVVSGMLRVSPLTAVIFAAGALALGGMPPFNVFLSEFLTVTASMHAGKTWLAIVILVLLTLVLAGLVRMISSLLFGPKPEPVEKGELGWLTTLPMCVLLVLMLVMGTVIPQPVTALLTDATRIVLGTDKEDSVTMAESVQPLDWPWTLSWSATRSKADEMTTGEVQ